MLTMGLAAVLLPLAAADVPVQGGEQLWAGRQVATGRRAFPVLGDVPTRTETITLATMQHTGAGIKLIQKPCEVNFNEVLGVSVSMTPSTIQSLPRVVVWLFPGKTNGTFFAKPWQTSWQDEDIDADGHPGATVRVDATICQGEVYVATTTTSRASFVRRGEEVVGEMTIRVQQRVLGASSYCLALGSRDTDETQSGTVRYRRVPRGTTCESLLAELGQTRPRSRRED